MVTTFLSVFFFLLSSDFFNQIKFPQYTSFAKTVLQRKCRLMSDRTVTTFGSTNNHC